MDKEIIKTAMQFMMRVNLSGQEVPAFNAVMNAMQNELHNDAESGVKNASMPFTNTEES